MGRKKLQVRVEADQKAKTVSVFFIFPDKTLPFVGDLDSFRRLVQDDPFWQTMKQHVPDGQSVKMRADFDQMLTDIESDFAENQ